MQFQPRWRPTSAVDNVTAINQLFMACVFQLKIRDLRINGMITVKLSDSGNEFVDQSQYDKTKKRRRLIVCVIFIVSKLAMPF